MKYFFQSQYVKRYVRGRVNLGERTDAKANTFEADRSWGGYGRKDAGGRVLSLSVVVWDARKKVVSLADFRLHTSDAGGFCGSAFESPESIPGRRGGVLRLTWAGIRQSSRRSSGRNP